jgi:acyl carrier protein
MNDVEQRLIKCFSAVFGGLTERELRSATSTDLEGWDSIATVTLITLIEEEFGIEVDTDHLERFVSFHSVLDYLIEIKEFNRAS